MSSNTVSLLKCQLPKSNQKSFSMFKFAVVICALIACVAAKPGLLHAPLAAPVAVVAAPAPVVTATSSQVVAKNYNGIAAAPIIAAAPLPVAPVAAPLAATTFAHPLAAPVVAKYAATPLASPVLARYAAAPLAAPFAYHAPLHYAAAPAPLFV